MKVTTKIKWNKRKKLILNWSLSFIFGLIALIYIASLTEFTKDPASRNDDGSVAGLTSVLARNVKEEMKQFQFEDVSQQSGLNFHHFPAKRQSLLPEDMGSGLAWGDFNNDGNIDLFLVNFKGNIDTTSQSPARHALYQNNGDGSFSDVTQLMKLDNPSYGMAAAWGDYDNDNDLDLYISNYGRNQLYRNDGKDGFVELAKTALVDDEGFGAGLSWGDFNNDGLIDLYVCNYVDFIREDDNGNRVESQYSTDIPFTINPSSYDAVANRLYKNNGDGSFTEVAEQAGVANKEGRSLVAAWFDFDNDGYQDLYVANDISENGVFHNNQDGSFSDIGASSLAADYRGAMGLAIGDYDRDEDFDLFVTHWLAQENALFKNNTNLNWLDRTGQKKIFFVDEGEVMGLGQISLKTVGWSTSFADFDNDGLLDLWVVNGNTMQQESDNSKLVPQYMHLFRQTDKKGFYEISRYSGQVFQQAFVGRGGAQADFNHDGRIDLALGRHGDTALLLKNTAKNTHNWVTLRLKQQGKNTQALGARVKITSHQQTQSAQIGSQGLYLSQNSTDIHFGLGDYQSIEEVLIVWPDGQQQTLLNIKPNTLHKLSHIPHY